MRGSRYRGGYYGYSRNEREDKREDGTGKDLSEKPRYREGSRVYSEDSKISKQLQRLSREENSERFLEFIAQLQDSVMIPENIKYVRRNADYILECLYEHLHTAPSRPCKWECSSCIGKVAHVMGNDFGRFLDMTFERMEGPMNEEVKVLLLRSIYHSIEIDTNKILHAQVAKIVIEGLHFILERTEALTVMVVTVDILRKIHEFNSSALVNDFQDIVDILVGWHIDHSQSKEVINYVSLSLQSFSKLWQSNSTFASTLLSQFVEDAEDFLQDVTSGDNKDIDYSEFEKISAFIGAFTTIVRSLGTQADITLTSSVSEEFLIGSFRKMVSVAQRICDIFCEESILASLNQLAFVMISLNITTVMPEISILIDLHQENINQMSFTVQLSLLSLLKQLIQLYGSSLDIDFLRKLMVKDSALMQLRFSSCEEVFNSVLKVYHTLFGLKNVPLLEETYKLILLELQLCLNCLEIPYSAIVQSEEITHKYSSKQAHIILSYNLDVLAEVANTRNSIIVMWALKPPLVQLLAVYLNPAHEKLAKNYPEVQENIINLLHAHCTKHSHYITSSSLIVGAKKFVPSTFTTDSPPFSSSNSTSENLLTVINLINQIFALQSGCSASVLITCVNWCCEIIIGCESSLLHLMDLHPFSSLLSGLIKVAYHQLEKVVLSSASALLYISKFIPFDQVKCSEEIVQLCHYYTTHVNEDIRSIFLQIFSSLPLSMIASTFDNLSMNKDNDYSCTKEGSIMDEAIINDINKVLRTQRKFFFQNSAQISPSGFHTVIKYLLNDEQPNDDWLTDLFIVNQRCDTISSEEDKKLGAIAPKFKMTQWKWVTWEVAQYCIANKLKTTLGKPLDTLTSIENGIKKLAKEAKDCSVTSKEHRVDKGGYNYILKIELLLEFIESLEKAMFVATDGCAVAPQPASKSVRLFFSTNRHTCMEWLMRVRAAQITAALHIRQPHTALRNACKLLSELVENNSVEGANFQRAVCYCAKAMSDLKFGEAITGLYTYLNKKLGLKFTWLQAIALKANNRYEEAIDSYKAYEKSNEDSEESEEKDPFIVELLNEQLLNCYINLDKWDDFEEDGKKIWAKHGSVNQMGMLNFLGDMSHIRCLGYFEEKKKECFDINKNTPSIVTDFKEWPLWRKMRKITANIYNCFELISNPNDSHDLHEIINDSVQELECLIELTAINFNLPLKMEILVNIQLLQELQSFLTTEVMPQFKLHRNWEKINMNSVSMTNVISTVSSYTRLASTIYPAFPEASISMLELSRAKSARKHNNFDFAMKTLLKITDSDGDLSQLILDRQKSETTIVSERVNQEAAKLLYCQGRVNDGVKVLANIVSNMNSTLYTLATNDKNLLALPPNDAGQLSASSIITLHKWWKREELKISNDEIPEWMSTIKDVYTKMKPFISEDLLPICEASHPSLSEHETNMGTFLVLGATQFPTMPKIWNELGAWTFKWGRKMLKIGTESDVLQPEDIEAISEVLKPFVSSEADSRLQEMCALLGSSKKVRGEEEDLRLEEVEGSQQLEAALTHMLTGWGADPDSVSGLVQSLLKIRCSAMQRGHTILTTSAKAYFKYLKLGSNSGPSDKQMIATLRLLRLIVKYAFELQEVLEAGLKETPTAPWKNIIPQLFARLSHPEPYVRSSMSELLCRLAKDSPHLIIFPAVVGASGTMSSKGNFTDMLDKYFPARVNELTEDLDETSEETNNKPSEEEEEEETSPDNIEDMERKTLMQNCFVNLVNTLKKESGASIMEVQTLIHELRRITLLWDELWLGTLAKNLSEMSRKCNQLKSDFNKLNNNPSLTSEQKEELAKKKYEIVFKPLIFALDHLTDITSIPPETPHERDFQETFRSAIILAKQSLIIPENVREPNQSLIKLKSLHQRIQKKSSYILSMKNISPVLAELKSTKISMPGVSTTNECITIAAVGSSVSVLPTKTKPKKLSFMGSDGKRYTYLFKGLEDLHLDQRIMQFLSTVNTMLSKNKARNRSLYKAHCYSVVPLGPRSGLIQWVGNATPLYGLYKRWQQRESQINILKSHMPGQKQSQSQASQIMRPSELYYNKLTPLLKEASIPLENRKSWPLSIQREVFLELIKETPNDLLSRELWQNSLSSCEWWNMTQAFNISTAVMSIVGYIIGLGDRHLDNLLINLSTGEIVHIDYNVCFEKGKNLKVPEKVPYRMTQNIEHALGISGVEGIFRAACELVLRTMRNGKETLLTLLEAFIYDPLVDWTPDSEAGFAGAIYGGDQSLVMEAKQSRKRLEKTLTFMMFNVRIVEMKHEWLENKDAVVTAIPPIIENLNKWNSTRENLTDTESKLQEGHQIMAMIKEAESNAQHSLYSLISRHKEYMVVRTTLQSISDVIRNKSTELQQWLSLYKRANTAFKKGIVMELNADLLQNRTIIPGLPLIKEHLSAAGQTQLVIQYENIEVELGKNLDSMVSVSHKILDSLGTYGKIWTNYPDNHLMFHRMATQFHSLSSIEGLMTLENVQSVITKHQCQDNTAFDGQAAQIDTHIRSKDLNLKTHLQKVYETMKEEGLNDAASIENSYKESLNAVTSFAYEQGEKGMAAVACALLNSLSQTLNMKLREDKAAASAGDTLALMKMRNVWWFDDSFASLTALLELIGLTENFSPSTSPIEAAVIKAMNLLQSVFHSMQDLIQNTSQIIVVEGGRLLSLKESTVMEIATRLAQLISDYSIPLKTLYQKLTHHLHMTIFRMPSNYENVVQEANNLHALMMTLVQQLTDTSFSDFNLNEGLQNQMSQGQMMLMGFHLLFESVDNHIDKLIEALGDVPLPHSWSRVDTVKLSTEIMGPLFDHSIREVVRAILRVKKVDAISSFFRMALELFTQNYISEVGEVQEKQLERVVKSYVSETMYRLFLGLPSYLATHFILINCQKLGVDVTGYIESRDVGTESRVGLSGIIELALENCIRQHNLQNIISSAADVVNEHLTISRKKASCRIWQNEVEATETLLRRVEAQILAHEWFYEDNLKRCGVTSRYQSSANNFLSDLKKKEVKLLTLNTSMHELREKHKSLIENIINRLKWASGSNPNIAEALEEFQQIVETNSNTIAEVTTVCDNIRLISTAVNHYENYRKNTPESYSEDQSFKILLGKVQESCVLTETYPGSISGNEELLISLCPLPSEMTPDWLQLASTTASNYVTTLTDLVSQTQVELDEIQSSVHLCVEELRQSLTVHHKLISDVRILLKSMAKFEQEGEFYGVDGFLCLYKRYSEIITSLVRQILHEPLTQQSVISYGQKLQQILLQTYVIYDKLIDFGNECKPESTSEKPSSLSDISFNKKTNVYTISRKYDLGESSKKNNEKEQEHNKYALSVWRRVKVKLEGRDPLADQVIPVPDQVEHTIEEAISIDNLASLYEGWTSWI